MFHNLPRSIWAVVIHDDDFQETLAQCRRNTLYGFCDIRALIIGGHDDGDGLFVEHKAKDIVPFLEAERKRGNLRNGDPYARILSIRLVQSCCCTSVCPRSAFVRASPGCFSTCRIQCARDSASPGVKKVTVRSSTTSRRGGRSAQTMGRPAARYSKSFNGDVSRWK